MPPRDPAALLAAIEAIARQAGAAILEVYSKASDAEFEIQAKDDASPLTRADLASHALIRDALLALTPEIPLLSEESATIPFSTRQQWVEYWLVDPLDGTKEFIKRNGEFTVNIALVRDHRPVLGVVYVPVQDRLYSGLVGTGAWRQIGESAVEAIHCLHPPRTTPVVVGSRSHGNPELERSLDRLGAYQLTSMGSSLKLCLVAEGSADLYPRLGPTSEWDTAAAQAVVEAAGGVVTDLAGQPLACNRKESYLNPWFLVAGDPATDWLARLGLPDLSAARD